MYKNGFSTDKNNISIHSITHNDIYFNENSVKNE